MSAFQDADRHSPNIPNDTCPTIDKAINEIEKVCDLLAAVTERRGYLEELRAANMALRECGIYWRDTAKEMSLTIDGLEDERDELRRQIAELHEQLATAGEFAA